MLPRCLQFLTGLPTTILDPFPALKAFRNDIASLPAVAAHYAKAEDDTRKNGYRPDV
jgi:glutathione S-transferase